jgi:8-oxo-dGTP pyrophosphatase MutT (NUDIX family)
MKFCTNCGDHTHHFKQCLHPILSYGIVLFKINLDKKNIKDKIQILLLERKHTYSYMDFIRGKYSFKSIQDINKLKLAINNMTITEVESILKFDFDTLWCKLWNIKTPQQLQTRFKKEYKYSKDKFNILKNKENYIFENGFTKYLKNIKNTLYKNPEYGFAKGRRNNKETDFECAIREFTEETNYNINDINILNYDRTFDEHYLAQNNIQYKHKYYIALCNTNKKPYIDIHNAEQINEIKSIKWCSLDDTFKSIRKYEKWKYILVKEVFNYLINYIKLYKKLYSL